MSFASVRFKRDNGLPSNTRQQPSHTEAQLTAAEVLKPKDTDRSSSDGDDATLQPGPDNVIDDTDAALWRYPGANIGDVGNVPQQQRWHLRCLIPVASLLVPHSWV